MSGSRLLQPGQTLQQAASQRQDAHRLTQVCTCQPGNNRVQRGMVTIMRSYLDISSLLQCEDIAAIPHYHLPSPQPVQDTSHQGEGLCNDCHRNQTLISWIGISLYLTHGHGSKDTQGGFSRVGFAQVRGQQLYAQQYLVKIGHKNVYFLYSSRKQTPQAKLKIPHQVQLLVKTISL